MSQQPASQTTIGQTPAGVPLRIMHTSKEASKGRIANAIPPTVIQNICEQLEAPPPEKTQPGTASTSSIALRKHSKNCSVQAVSQVCKGWRLCAAAFKCLWRDIAFDVAEAKNIHLATTFLSLVEDSDIPLHIYVGFGDDRLWDPGMAKLLDELRSQTNRWGVFEYQGRLGKYASYLTLPAPNLRYFSDHDDYSQDSEQLFAGHTPSLHSLFVSSTRRWESIPLLSLTKLHLEQVAHGSPPSLNSLLRLFGSAPSLETLRLEKLGSFIHDCPADAIASLLHLKTIQVHNSNFVTVAEHIFAPNLLTATFTADTPTHPFFAAPNALAGLPSIPILDQFILEVTTVVAHTKDKGVFGISLTAAEGRSLDIYLVWDAGILEDWQNYVTETVFALAGRIQLDPTATLHLYLGIRPSLKEESPGSFVIHRGFASSFLETVSRTGVLFPPTTRELYVENNPPVLDDDETGMLRLFLGSRESREGIVFVHAAHGNPLSMTGFGCPDGCTCPYDFLEFEFHSLEDD